MKTLLSLLLLTVATFAQTNPLPLGTIESSSVTCPGGFLKGAVCQSVTVACPEAGPLTATLGIRSGKLGQTVLMMNGSEGTTVGLAEFAGTYSKFGFTVAQFEWATAWQSTGIGNTPNVMNAACQPATLLNYVANGQQIYVHAASGGSGALAYAMSWYGLAPLVKFAVLTNGPVYSNIMLGCETPKPLSVTVYPTNGTPYDPTLYYNAGVPPDMTGFTGYQCEPKTATSASTNAAWMAQSINASGAETNFPGTTLSLWYCETAQTPNNSGGQGWQWLLTLNPSIWQLTGLFGCTGSEGLDNATTLQGETGYNAIVAEMEAQP